VLPTSCYIVYQFLEIYPSINPLYLNKGKDVRKRFIKRNRLYHLVNYHLAKSKDQPYLHILNNMDFQPVFILGVHRSGTSILYKMLTATGCFNPVTAYHLINYDELLFNYHEEKVQDEKQRLTESLQKEGLSDRGIDQLKVTADFAEEYGFLLGSTTLQMRITKKNIQLFTELCKKISFIAGNQKPILLKNPYDFPNFLYLKEHFPNARFVFIHRHPVKTISSTLHAIRILLQEKNPYTARLSRVYDQWYANPILLKPLRFLFHFLGDCCVVALTRMTKKSITYYLKNIGKLPHDRYISITYEELCDHPQETLQTILGALSFNMQQDVNAGRMIKPRSAPIDKSVEKLRGYISRSLKEYYHVFHYSADV
jgi:hypothetical protein